MSLGQVRQLPYQEIREWQLYYLLEPWGFHDREYRTAALLAKLHNINIGKRSQAKNEKDFMRDMPKEVLRAVERHIRTEKLRRKYSQSTKAERIRMLKQAWGTMAKDVKLGNGSNSSG
jgi:cell wall assembly regulator SMI1